MFKNLKKTICMILVLSLLISIVPVFAINNLDNHNVESIFSYDVGEEKIEISDIDGAIMYFHDTKNYTFVCGVYLGGMIEISKFDKNVKKLSSSQIYKNELNEDMLNLLNYNYKNSDTIRSFFSQVEKDVNNGILELNENPKIKSHKVQSVPYALDENSEKVKAALESKFGKEYNGKYTLRYKYRGHIAKLYETMLFEYHYDYMWFFPELTTLGSVAAVLKILPPMAFKLFFWSGNSIQGYHLLTGAEANKYMAIAHYTKYPKVKDRYPYRSGKTVYGHVYVGDKTGAYIEGWTNANDDFDDNAKILRIAIDNFIKLGW